MGEQVGRRAQMIGGRSTAKAQQLADRLGMGARAAAPRKVVTGRDAVLLAVPWDGAEDMLRSAGASEGLLEGTLLIDPTNAVKHGIGVLLTGHGEAMAERIAAIAPGAHVVKAFHLFPAEQWARAPGQDEHPVTVAMCGDDPAALQVASELVRDAGAVPAVLGSLDRARQLEEVAGFVIGLAFTGLDPASAVPRPRTGHTAICYGAPRAIRGDARYLFDQRREADGNDTTCGTQGSPSNNCFLGTVSRPIGNHCPHCRPLSCVAFNGE